MKKNLLFSHTLLVFFFSISAVACKEADKKISYSASIASGSSIALQPAEEQFLVAAHNLLLYNRQLAAEAQIRSTSVESVALAESVMETSRKINERIASVAGQNGLALASDITEEQKYNWKEVVKQKGWAFDRKFAVVMEENLKALHTLFIEAAGFISDPAIKKLATEALAGLQAQGELAIAQQEKITERTGELLLNDKYPDKEKMAVHTAVNKFKQQHSE